MIRIENISKSFGDRLVLDNITATFERGKTNLIIGESGSGKTVLTKICIGLFEPDSGVVTFDNRPFSNTKEKNKIDIRKEMGVLFQGGALFDSMNVEENVMFPLNMFTDMTYEEKLERVNFCLNRVNLKGVNNLMTSELSGGMMKRVAIARAISNSPKYLFCDEPNSGLDPQTSLKIDELIHGITTEFGITTIVNTHDMNSVMGIGDHILFLAGGKLAWEGDKTQILNTDNTQLNEFLFSSEILRQVKEQALGNKKQ